MVRYLESFFRNKWLTSIPALLLLFAGASLVRTEKPEYTARATIWTEQLAYLDLPRNEQQRWLSPAEVALRRLNELRQSFSFVRAIVDRTVVGQQGTEEDKQKLATKIQEELWTITLGDNSLRIGFAHEDPQVTLSVLQVAIDEYTRVTNEQATLQSTEAVAFYRERIQQLETKTVPEASQALVAYLDAHPNARNPQVARTDPNYAWLEQQADAARDELERNKQRLDAVLAQSDAVERNQMVAFRVLDPPSINQMAGVGKTKMVMYAGLGAALSLSYIALFVLLATELDRTMRNVGDVRRGLGLPVLEVVPDYSQRAGEKRRGGFMRRRRVVTTTASSTSGG